MNYSVHSKWRTTKRMKKSNEILKKYPTAKLWNEKNSIYFFCRVGDPSCYKKRNIFLQYITTINLWYAAENELCALWYFPVFLVFSYDTLARQTRRDTFTHIIICLYFSIYILYCIYTVIAWHCKCYEDATCCFVLDIMKRVEIHCLRHRTNVRK